VNVWMGCGRCKWVAGSCDRELAGERRGQGAQEYGDCRGLLMGQIDSHRDATQTCLVWIKYKGPDITLASPLKGFHSFRS
jgi:hypothetical protein